MNSETAASSPYCWTHARPYTGKCPECSTSPGSLPLSTWIVKLHATDRVLLRGACPEEPRFEPSDRFSEQVAEFPSRSLAVLARDYVEGRTELGARLLVGDLSLSRVEYVAVTESRENAILCRVRDSVIWLGWCEYATALSRRRRALIGIESPAERS